MASRNRTASIQKSDTERNRHSHGEPSAEPQRFTFTIEDAYAIEDAGVFQSERVELVGGQFIVKEPASPPHSGMVNRLVQYFRKRPDEAPVLHVQNPLRVSDTDLPEPDVAILRHRNDLYRDEHPQPKDVLLVIEVAHSSLSYDQSTKASLYAAAGIGTYWVVDLNARCVHVYGDPTPGGYGTVKTVETGATLDVPGAVDAEIPVADLFPRRPSETPDASNDPK